MSKNGFIPSLIVGVAIVLLFFIFATHDSYARTVTLTEVMTNWPFEPDSWGAPNITGGDTIVIDSARVTRIWFRGFAGSPDNWITITNQSDSKPTISPGAGNNGIVIEDCTYIKVRGDSYGAETYGIGISGGASGVRVNDVNATVEGYVEISYLEIHGQSTTGITANSLATNDGEVFEGLKIHNNKFYDQDFEGIYINKSSCSNCRMWKDFEIYNNIMDTIGGDCIDIKGSAGSANKIYGNILTDCGEDLCLPPEQNKGCGGIGLGHGNYDNGSTIDIYNNFIEWDGGGGIYFGWSSDTYNIYNNVIWETGPSNDALDKSAVDGSLDTGSSIANITNNTIVGSENYGIVTETGQTSGSIKYNLVVETDNDEISSDISDQADNRESTAVANEDFLDCETLASCNGDFHLTATSPAVNAGTGAGYIAADYDDVLRPQGGAADIGAFEFPKDFSRGLTIN